MSDRLLRDFRICFINAARNYALPLHHTSLRDFLLSAVEFEWVDAAELAAHALNHFCVEDGRFNGFEIAIAAVFRFLEQQAGRTAAPSSVRQAARDLKQILDHPPIQPAALAAWARSHFPAS